MPSVSKKQHNLMAAVANNPAFAKKAGIPQSVGSEFIKADKGKKFSKGGDMKKLPPFMGKETKAEEAKEMKIKAKSPAMYRMGENIEDIHGKYGMKKPTKYASGGFTKSANGIAKQGKTKGQRFDIGGVVNPNAMAGTTGTIGTTGTTGTTGLAGTVGATGATGATKKAIPVSQMSAAEKTAYYQQRPRLNQSPPARANPITRRSPVTVNDQIRKMYAGNEVASQYNPTGPDPQAMKYWRDKIQKEGLATVNNRTFGQEVSQYAAANPMKKGGAVKPKAYAKGGCVSSTPAMKSGGNVKKARGGGCEVKGKTKGRYI